MHFSTLGSSTYVMKDCFLSKEYRYQKTSGGNKGAATYLSASQIRLIYVAVAYKPLNLNGS